MDVTAVAAGDNFALALKSDGSIWAWGDNYRGQLGNGSEHNSAVPVKVFDLSEVVAISAGSNHGLALKRDGTVWAWGDNQCAQLGSEGIANSSVPVRVGNMTGIIQIDAGDQHNLALKNDGVVWAWGWNFTGQVGSGEWDDSDDADFYAYALPTLVKNLNNVIAVSAGGSHSLALKRDGTVWAWGNNGFGQLGVGGNNQIMPYPVQVISIDKAISVMAGRDHSMALGTGGKLWCWGGNMYGQLANDGKKDSNLPIQLNNGVIRADASDHILALHDDGSLWGWGFNKFGQVSGTGTVIPLPVRINLER